MKHIVYAAAACSEETFGRIFESAKGSTSFQAQKYHRLFIEGLAAHTRVDVVGYPPVDASSMTDSSLRPEDETAGGADYHYVRLYRSSLRRRLHLAWGTFRQCLSLLDRNSAVMIDCLNQMSGLGALLASRIRGCRCVGIVTDLPEFMGGGLTMALSNFLIRHCTDYVVLTEAMNDKLNPKGKPHVVLEGHADITMESRIPGHKAPQRICLYAGSIHRIYGIANLVEGFRLAGLPEIQLHIYGSGDYLEELQRLTDPNVVYGGMLLPNQVVEKEMEAALLVNPRPVDEEFVKYSFPSKTMEYMSTGTPVLTTMLPGLPEEYRPYLYFIREPTPEGIACALREVFARSDRELFDKGCEARDFVLKQRNNVVQAKKVLHMLEGSREK